MGEEFGFVGGDVDGDGAVALASFAGQAEVEGVFDFFTPPSVADDPIFAAIALGHFPEQVSAAASGVFFFVRDAPTGAHHAAGFTRAFATALADADAAESRSCKTAVIDGKLEVGGGSQGA